MPTEFCPECELPVYIGARPRMGQRVRCAHCGTNLQVTEVFPLELYWVDDRQPVVSVRAGNSPMTRSRSSKRQQ
jgi:hypothetical protein